MGNEVALIVLNYNNAVETAAFVESISQYRNIDAVQIVDNASTDASYSDLLAAVQKIDSCKISLVKAPLNGGYGRGNNYAVSQLKLHFIPEYLLIANPDIQITESAISAMVHFLDEHCEYAAAAPVMLNIHKEVCQSAWKLPSIGDMWLNALRLAIGVIRDPLDYGDYETRSSYKDAGVLPGSLFMIRLSDFEQVDGFDEDTFLYGEANLLFAKLNFARRKAALLLNYNYVHAHGSSINKEISSVHKRYLMLLDSNLIYCKKILHMSETAIFFYRHFYRACLLIFSVGYMASNLIKPRS